MTPRTVNIIAALITLGLLAVFWSSRYVIVVLATMVAIIHLWVYLCFRFPAVMYWFNIILAALLDGRRGRRW